MTACRNCHLRMLAQIYNLFDAWRETMDLALVSTVINIWKHISVAAWTGSDILFIVLVLPSLRNLQGESRAGAHQRLFSLGKNYFRFIGISTVVAAILLMVPSLRVDPTSTYTTDALLFGFFLLIAAYPVVGEGFVLRFLSRYSSIAGSLDGKERGGDIPHLSILEGYVTEAIFLQLVILIVYIGVIVYTGTASP